MTGDFAFMSLALSWIAPEGLPEQLESFGAVGDARQLAVLRGRLLMGAAGRRRRGEDPLEGRSESSENIATFKWVVSGSDSAPGKLGKGGCHARFVMAETLRGNPAGRQSRAAKVGHQPEPRVAWCGSDPRCEAYPGSVQAV